MDKKTEIAGLVERFSDLPDPRVEGRTDHDLLDIVVLALCAVMSGRKVGTTSKTGDVSGKRGCGGICACATVFLVRHHPQSL
ncbi:MAG: transposase family protein [Uliginosibacterium sp.]|nr:transposase family protein [Uliginosibacterium sp.]